MPEVTCPHCHKTIEDAAPLPGFEDNFEAFYEAYPRKEARGGAHRSYKTARKKASHEVIMAGVQRSIAFWQADGRLKVKPYTKVPQPTTWLNQERWKDDYGETSHNGGTEDHGELLRQRLNGEKRP
jgi:hypothetical protein